MSAKLSGDLTPPTPETIEVYRAAVRAWRRGYQPPGLQDSQYDPSVPRAAAIAAVKKLRPSLSCAETEALALRAIAWAEHVPNEFFWDL